MSYTIFINSKKHVLQVPAVSYDEIVRLSGKKEFIEVSYMKRHPETLRISKWYMDKRNLVSIKDETKFFVM